MNSTLNEQTLAKESLAKLAAPNGPLERAAQVVDLVAHNSVGLGEVLQDYAHQALNQLHDIIQAARNISVGMQSQDDMDILQNAHFIVKTTKMVLEMTPNAMIRNKADTLGEKEKLTLAQIAHVSQNFIHCPDIQRFLASEDSGRMLIALFGAGDQAAMISPEHANVFLHTPLNH